LKPFNRKNKARLKVPTRLLAIGLAIFLISAEAESRNAATLNKAKSAKRKLMDYIVVFKKDVSPEAAQQIMKKSGHPHKSGIDSSRGKVYFYNTGPKFILQSEEKNFEALKKYFSSFSEIHEIYVADWKIKKD
jgi:hypothetical protein